MKRKLIVLIMMSVLLIGFALASMQTMRLVKGESSGSKFKAKGSDADKQAFLELLEKYTAWDLSFADDGETIKKVLKPDVTPKKQSLHDKLKTIIESGKPVEIEVGRSLSRVLVDAFGGDGKGEVDLDDFDKLPDPVEGSKKISKAEVLAHVLNEYYKAAINKKIGDRKNGGTWTKDDDYKEGHKKGIESQNKVREENSAEGKKEYPGPMLVGGKVEIPFYIPDPADPTKKKEIYREKWKLSDANIDEIEARSGFIVIPSYVPESLLFKGHIIEIFPSPPAYSGSIFMTQQVKYQNVSFFDGNFSDTEIIVHHVIVSGSADVDPNLPQLKSTIFHVCNELLVEAEKIIDPTSGNFTYISFTVYEPGVGGSFSPADHPPPVNSPMPLTPRIILYMTVVTIAIITLYAKKHYARKPLPA